MINFNSVVQKIKNAKYKLWADRINHVSREESSWINKTLTDWMTQHITNSDIGVNWISMNMGVGSRLKSINLLENGNSLA